MTDIQTILGRLSDVQQIAAPNEWLAKCPAHYDEGRSLVIIRAKDRVVLYCSASCECSTAAILGSIDLSPADLVLNTSVPLLNAAIVQDLEAPSQKSIQLTQDPKTPFPQSRDKVLAMCAHLAHRDNILSIFAHDLRESGVVGEERSGKLLYLALTSRILERPISVAVKGPSSAGKSFLASSVLKYFPSSSYIEYSSVSEKALLYSEDDFRHKFLVIAEASGMSNDFVTYTLRTLLSEGRLLYESVEKTTKGLRPVKISKEGPTGLLVTTTKLSLHPENETRMFSIPITDTPEQTKKIMASIARRYAGGCTSDSRDFIAWHALQDWLAEGPRRVAIPFAKKLVELIPETGIRLRRDVSAILGLISAHALLHQAARTIVEEGNVVIAELRDYEEVRELVHDLVSQGVKASVSPEIREVVEAVTALSGDSKHREGCSVHEVARYIDIDDSAASRRLAKAKQLGYLDNEEIRKGRPARYVVDEDIEVDRAVLPTSPELALACRSA